MMLGKAPKHLLCTSTNRSRRMDADVVGVEISFRGMKFNDQQGGEALDLQENQVSLESFRGIRAWRSADRAAVMLPRAYLRTFLRQIVSLDKVVVCAQNRQSSPTR